MAQGDSRGRGKEVVLGLKAHEDALQVLDMTQLLRVRDTHSEHYIFTSDNQRARTARFTTIMGEAQGVQQSPVMLLLSSNCRDTDDGKTCLE